MSIVQAVRMASANEEYPVSLFFPRQHLGGNRELLDHAGHFMIDRGNGLKMAGEGSVMTLMESSLRLIVLAKRDSLLRSVFPEATGDEEKFRQKALEKRGTVPEEDELFLEIPSGVFEPVTITREELRVLLPEDVISKVCDYLRMLQVRTGAKRIHVVEIEASKKGLNGELFLPDEEFYCPTAQKARFIPVGPDQGDDIKYSEIHSGLMVSSNGDLLKRILEGTEYKEIKSEAVMGICRDWGLPVHSLILYLNDIEVHSGIYNASDYRKDLSEQMSRWSKSFWKSGETS